LPSPGYGATCGLLTPGQCAGYIGGYVQSSSGTLASNSDASSVFVIRATMPNVAGTFVGVGGLFGSTDTSGTTQLVIGLYNDNGGSPYQLVYDTNFSGSTPNTMYSFNDPSGLVRIQSQGGEYFNSFSDALPANSTWWPYMKVGQSMGGTGGISSSQCLGADWINIAPPGQWSYASAKSCPGDFDLYMLVTFP
jgi:hypothetical protein